MGVIEDVRKVVQDLVTPDLKALSARMDSLEESTKLKFEALSEKMDARFNALAALMDVNYRALNAKIDSNHATVINSLNIDKRLEAPEHDRAHPSRYFFPPTGYPCHTYSSASGRICALTARSVCPAFRANTNW